MSSYGTFRQIPRFKTSFGASGRRSWRVQHTVQLEREGRHLLLCGDPVAAVEVLAAPTAGQLGGFAACLLDADRHAQAARLAARGDPPGLLPHHQAFADWMRAQASDPGYMLEVMSSNGWPDMRWDRLPALRPVWTVETVDKTRMTPATCAAEVKSWISGVLSGSVSSVDPRVI